MKAKIKIVDARRQKLFCGGCRENFYNGNNPAGIQDCWCLKSAKIVQRKFVPLDMRPPWEMAPETTFSCHRRIGFVAVRPETVC
jgi:hypothetical protein